MDIASLSTSLATANLQNSVSVSMLAKSLDNSEVLADGLMDILDSASMERSVTPYLGGNIDILL